MSALAHMIEARGIATVVVGLVRPHVESSRPPRALWVPFPLGRPFGEAENPAFQRKVLMAALGLLARTDGPVVLEDYPEDAPSMRDTEGWSSPITLPPRPSDRPGTPQAWLNAMATELAAVAPHWATAHRATNRTLVGNSRLAPDAWAPYLVGFLDGAIPDSPVPGISAAVLARYVADDLKAYYSEALQGDGRAPSPQQVNRWFWGQTLAADLLRAVRAAAIASSHNGFNTAGSRFVVPAPFVARA